MRGLVRFVFSGALLVTIVIPSISRPAASEEMRAIGFPIDGMKGRFSNDFGAPRSGGRSHQGNDIFANKLDLAVAAVDGKITTARLDSSGNSGNMIVLRDAEGWEYWYMHINNDSPGTDNGANPTVWAMIPGLRPGARVVKGQPIGFVGDSGNAEGTAPHLHFEIHTPSGEAINPYESLQSATRDGFANNHPGARSPFGSIDLIKRTPGGIRIAGWSIDPDSTGSVTVMAYPNGYWGGEVKASQERPDLVGPFPNAGIKHGFSMVVPIGNAGSYSTCVYGSNIEAGFAGLLGCPRLDAKVSPFGSIDVVERIPGGDSISGWVIDPDTADPVDVHFYVDGSFIGSTKGATERPDLSSAFPDYGGGHGFQVDLAVGEGFHVLCAYGINFGAGENSLIGCSWLMNTGDPWSSIDVIERQDEAINVAGWAIDPDTAAQVPIHIYVDGLHAGSATTDRPRPDVGSLFPRYGIQHGFAFKIPATNSSHMVCAYALNAGPGRNTLAGCKRI